MLSYLSYSSHLFSLFSTYFKCTLSSLFPLFLLSFLSSYLPISVFFLPPFLLFPSNHFFPFPLPFLPFFCSSSFLSSALQRQHSTDIQNARTQGLSESTANDRAREVTITATYYKMIYSVPCTFPLSSLL
jgi:hypothetical protein